MKTRITSKERDRLEILKARVSTLKARVSTMQRELDGLCVEAWIILFGQDTLVESIGATDRGKRILLSTGSTPIRDFLKSHGVEVVD